MQFITLYTVDPEAMTKGPPSPDHMAAAMKKTNEALAAGRLLVSGAIGKRAAVAARITLKDGKYTVDAAPEGPSVLYGAMGFSISNAESKDAMIEEVKTWVTERSNSSASPSPP